MLEVSISSYRQTNPPASPAILLRDSPRPMTIASQRRPMRFETGSTSNLKTWIVQLLRARETMRSRNVEMDRSMIRASTAFPNDGEFAVTLLVSTTFYDNESMVEANFTQMQQQVPDWEITFEQQDEEGPHQVEMTRHVRVYQGEDGLGLTLIGKSPVVVQEVDEGGPAYAAGIRPGDAIRAVNGEECTSMSHEEVVKLIRSALFSQRQAWLPVERELNPIPDAEETEAELVEAAYTRGYDGNISSKKQNNKKTLDFCHEMFHKGMCCNRKCSVVWLTL